MSADEWAVVAPHYGLDRSPNFEQHAWNLREVVPLIDVAAMRRIEPTAAAALLASAKTKLLAARATRVRPGRDDKILTAWNALMIAALARSARLLGRPEWSALAFAALDRLRSTAWRDGRLLATRKDGDASLNAYLDDHAFLLAALIECMQTEFRPVDLEWAKELGDQLLNRFEDREQGGFWFTSDDHEALFHRHKPGHDNATPSGNGVAARALAALEEIAGEPRYRQAHCVPSVCLPKGSLQDRKATQRCCWPMPTSKGHRRWWCSTETGPPRPSGGARWRTHRTKVLLSSMSVPSNNCPRPSPRVPGRAPVPWLTSAATSPAYPPSRGSRSSSTPCNIRR